jgi:hypothetical protein
LIVIFAAEVLQVMGKFMYVKAARNGILLVLDSFINVNNPIIVVPTGGPAFFITETGMLYKKAVRTIFNNRWYSGMRILGKIDCPAQ